MKVFNPNFLLILTLMVFLISSVSTLKPNPHPKPPFNCDNPAPNTCRFYRDCLGTKCGFKGYQKNYGYKYCNKFTKLMRKLTPEGKEWATATMTCLQQSLVSVDCSKLEDVGFGSHARCYVHNGVKSMCEIPRDWDDILKTISFGDLFGSKKKLKAVLNTGYG